jgi:4-amino-4-deoxy-L-arabinose transferase-like glycosyltransferase
LWIDEFISLIDAHKLPLNKGRFLYYPLLRAWIWLGGDGDAWLRGLSVLFALGSVFLLYQLGRFLLSKSIGLLAALMLSVSPLFVNHAQEVRYYTISTFLGIAGTLALAHALENPTPLAARLGWAVLRFLAILTTPLNGILLAPDCLLVALKFRQQRRLLFAFGKMVLLLLVFCLPVALSTIGSVTSGEHQLVGPIPGLRHLLRELRILTAFSYPPPSPYLPRLLQVYSLLLVGVLAIALFQKPRSEKILWVAAWGFLPLAMIFAYSHLWESVWITRYLMFAYPYLFILLAAGILKIWQRWRAVAVGVSAAYVLTVVSGLVYYYTVPGRYMGASGEIYRSITQTINTNQKPGDSIVWSIIHNTAMPLEHYYRGSAPIYVKEPIQKFDRSNIESWLRSLPAIESRLWLVHLKASPVVCDVVEEQFEVLETYDQFGQCSLFLVKPKSQK